MLLYVRHKINDPYPTVVFSMDDLVLMKLIMFFLSAKFGGWLGVAIGASVISFVEMTGYVVCFILRFVKRKVDWE